MKIFKILLFLIVFNLSIFADVILNAPNHFVKGESYIFEFEAAGNSVKFPKIEKIDGLVVENLGTSRSLQIINGNYDEKISQKYRIVPQKSFEIPSFTFEIDGEDVSSKSKKVTEEKVKKTASDNFDLTLIPSKKELYVGEELTLKLFFKYKRGLQITNLGFEPPHFDNFWYKKIDNSNKRYEENGYIIQELDFLLFPQKSGKLTINPLRVDVQMIQSNRNSKFMFFGAVPKVVKVYSNKLEFDVKNLPQNVNLIGDFNINASIDKSKLKLGESVSYKVTVDGVGNFDDIQDFKIDIPNATIYENKPGIKTDFTKDGYRGEYTKVFSIVPSSSIEIKPLELRYFNKKQNKVITKKTESFKIEVEGEQPQKVVLEKPKEVQNKNEKVIVKSEVSLREKIIYFIFGIIFALLIFGLYNYVKLQNSKKEIKERPIIKVVKGAKDKDELIKTLVPLLKKDSKLDEFIFECQKGNKEFKILKKEILERLKELNL